MMGVSSATKTSQNSSSVASSAPSVIATTVSSMPSTTITETMPTTSICSADENQRQMSSSVTTGSENDKEQTISSVANSSIPVPTPALEDKSVVSSEPTRDPDKSKTDAITSEAENKPTDAYDARVPTAPDSKKVTQEANKFVENKHSNASQAGFLLQRFESIRFFFVLFCHGCRKQQMEFCSFRYRRV